MKALVVDDEPAIRDICSRFLEKEGWEVSVAASGDEAAKRLGEGWDVILSDLSMPGSVDGNELVRRARAAGSADVILMTAFPELSSAIQAMRDGAYDYLIKPFTNETLLLAVRRCAEKRRLHQELTREKILRAELDKAYFELAQMEKVKETFGQFATPEIAKLVLAHPSDFWKRGERKEVSILFSDVRSFTPFAAQVPPEEVVWALNDIFARVIAAVQKEGGIVNKFIGDGMMALFGAPVPAPDHAEAAARAALRARDAIEELAEARRKLDLQPLRIGLGVNSGEVVAGCLGTRDRAEYSVIGNAVNLAARLEESAGPGQILIGPETVKLIGSRFETRSLGPRTFAGIEKPVVVAELLKGP